MQDDCAPLSKWFATRLDALYQYKNSRTNCPQQLKEKANDRQRTHKHTTHSRADTGQHSPEDVVAHGGRTIGG
jgi:hypothetical protein